MLCLTRKDIQYSTKEISFQAPKIAIPLLLFRLISPLSLLPLAFKKFLLSEINNKKILQKKT